MIKHTGYKKEKYIVNNTTITRFYKNKNPEVSICIPLYEWDIWLDQSINNIFKYKNKTSFELIIAEKKQSVAINRNIAQRESRSNFICQFDGDADVTGNYWLDKLFNAIQNDPTIGIIGGISVFMNGEVDHCGTVLVKDKKITDMKIQGLLAGYPENMPITKKEALNYFYLRTDEQIAIAIPYTENKEKIDDTIYIVYQCTGVIMLYDKRRIGEFAQNVYEGSGWDDVDFMARARDCGYKIMIHGGVRLIHPNHKRTKEEDTIRSSKKSDRSFKIENLIRHINRHGEL